MPCWQNLRSLAALALPVALLAAVVTDGSADTSAASRPARTPELHHIVAAGLAADSATSQILHTCDPSNPSSQDFSLSDVEVATLEGGQVVSGVLSSHCSEAAQDLFVEARVTLEGAAQDSLAAAFPNFGLIPPGGQSPIAFVMPATGAVTHMVIQFLRYTQPANPPHLAVVAGNVESRSDQVSVHYTVTNTGDGPAIMPRAAVRLTGCDSPFVFVPLNNGDEVAAGTSISGELPLPGSCTGVPQFFAGSDAQLEPAPPPGWSFRGAQSFYTGDGVLHLLAVVCNNNPSERYLYPAFRVLFHGSPDKTADIYDTTYFPAGSCRPLVTSFDAAPAGLTFSGLQAVDTGDGFQSVMASQATDGRIEPLVMKGQSARIYAQNIICFWLKSFGALLQHQVADTGGPVIVAYNVGAPFPDVRTLPAREGGDVVSLLYNDGSSGGSLTAATLQGIGLGIDGRATAGLSLNDLPAVGPGNWAIVDLAPENPAIVRVDDSPADFRIIGAAVSR